MADDADGARGESLQPPSDARPSPHDVGHTLPAADCALPAAGCHPSAAPRLQFSLRGLLVVQAVCAVFLTLLVLAGYFGLWVAFVATLGLAAWRVRPEKQPAKRLVVDILGGIVLPILCFVYDPGVVVDAGGEFLALVYLVVGFQMALLAAWKMTSLLTRRLNRFFAGALSVGVLVAAGFAVALAPLAVIGTLFVLIGIVAWTPALTASVYFRNVRQALREAEPPADPYVIPWPFLVGLLVAVGVPAVIYFAVGGMLSEMIPAPTAHWLDVP